MWGKRVYSSSADTAHWASESVVAVPLSYAADAQWHLRCLASMLQDETGGGSAGVTVYSVHVSVVGIVR